LVLAGTQDNGTLQFRNNSAFYRSAGGDGGFVAIDPKNPNNFWRQYVRTSLYHSTTAGRIEDTWWRPIDEGIKGNPCLFYAPFTLDQSNPKNIAFGSDRIFLDTDRGHGGWRAPGSPVKLRGLLSKEEADTLNKGQELISAINYVNSDPGLMYVGTNYGKVFRVIKIDGKWEAILIHDFSQELIERKIWDIATHPNDINTIIVVMAGFGSKEQPLSHVWRGIVPKDNIGTPEWTDINPRSDKGEIIDIPVNAIVIDDQKPEIMYIGTDIGVFRTIDSGKSWIKFSEGLPNCAVFDMRLYTDNLYEDQKPKQLLRIATHGRGMWERRLDVDTMLDVDIFVRDHLMDTGRFTPSRTPINAAFDDQVQDEHPKSGGVKLDSKLEWYMCADIKVDPPFYKFNDIRSVDYIKFESELPDSDLKRETVNHIYVQIHNRGIKPAGQDAANKVKIKLMYANVNDTDLKYPNLPSDFWTGFSDNSFDMSDWKPIGEDNFLPFGDKTLTSTEPTIVAWKWMVPPDIADSVALLVIIDSPEDSIPEKNKKVFDIENLVCIEKHIGLRKFNVINI
jgi:hypothetical protein